MKDLNNIVLFMGQLREKTNFFAQIELFSSLLDEGLVQKIYYITDHNVIDDETEIFLNKYNVNIITKPALTDSDLLKFDPDILSRVEKLRKVSGGVRSGTIWRQLYDLDFALNLLPDNCRILRTRTDIYIERAQLEKIFQRNEVDIAKKDKYKIFDEKIWVQWFSLHTPYYIHDTAFYGLKADLRKIVSSNINQELARYYPTVSLPVFFWILPFQNESKEIRSWLEFYSKNKYTSMLLLDEKFLYMLLTYYKYIQSNFDVNYRNVSWALQWEPGVMQFRIWKESNLGVSIIDNLLFFRGGQKAVENNCYLKENISEFESFIKNKSYKKKTFIIKVFFNCLLRKLYRL